MADASEDNLVPSFSGNDAFEPGNSADSTLAHTVDEEDVDEIADFRFLALNSKVAQKIPSRGTKDFEAHGTQLQVSVLDASREAMHNVLNDERVHTSQVETAVWDPLDNGAWVNKETSKLFQTVGRHKPVPGKQDDKTSHPNKKPKRVSRLYLLPEEALWLVERGSLDIRWPAEQGQLEDSGLPMSQQAAHATLIGHENEGGLTLEKFIVYQYLKRSGYFVCRAEDNWHNVPTSPPLENSKAPTGYLWSIWHKLFEEEDQDERLSRRITGPLVKPGFYRDYKSIYRQLALIPYHNALGTPSLIPAPKNGPSITYHVYKARSKFRKTDPGPPDFYISVINAQESATLTEQEIETLLRQTPFHPRNQEQNIYRGLKDGTRNVILAIVDRGVTSLTTVSDAGFGNLNLWERKKFNRGGPSKRGGFSGRGRGRDGRTG